MTYDIPFPICVLAVDPAYAACGYSVLYVYSAKSKFRLLASGTIVTSANTPFHKRIWQIQSALEELIIKHDVNVLAVEQFFGFKASSAFKVAHARGTVVVLAAKHNLEFVEVAPNRIKVHTIGDGTASNKGLIKKAVGERLGIAKFAYDDESDACALALLVGDSLQGGFFDQIAQEPPKKASKKRKTSSKKNTHDVKEVKTSGTSKCPRAASTKPKPRATKSKEKVFVTQGV